MFKYEKLASTVSSNEITEQRALYVLSLTQVATHTLMTKVYTSLRSGSHLIYLSCTLTQVQLLSANSVNGYKCSVNALEFAQNGIPGKRNGKMPSLFTTDYLNQNLVS